MIPFVLGALQDARYNLMEIWYLRKRIRSIVENNRITNMSKVPNEMGDHINIVCILRHDNISRRGNCFNSLKHLEIYFLVNIQAGLGMKTQHF